MSTQKPKDIYSGTSTGFYFTSNDGSVRVAAATRHGAADKAQFEQIHQDIQDYKWKDGDFLLAAYPKNGTHFMWEVMMMLARGSTDYIIHPKVACMMDLFPLSKIEQLFSSPKVINTHYRLDVLPQEFQGRKTVLVLRNPKDTIVSAYFHAISFVAKRSPESKVSFNFSEFLKHFCKNTEQPYSTYFDYVSYMWRLAKDNPNILVVFFEDMKKDLYSVVKAVDVFMGTQRSVELMREVAEATSFGNMKASKNVSDESVGPIMIEFITGWEGVTSDMESQAEEEEKAPPPIYRKGAVGDWKNHFSDADNKLVDDLLNEWEVGKEIDFCHAL